MFSDIRRAKTHEILAFPTGEGAAQRMRRAADEGLGYTAFAVRHLPDKPKFESLQHQRSIES